MIIKMPYKKENKREEKGKSIIKILDNYIVIDLETTGYDPNYNKIIEIGAIKIENNKIVDKFQCLIKPTFLLDEYIEKLTGITNEMLEGAPSIEEIISDFQDFIGNSILIGHNAHFDINFLYDDYEKHLKKGLTNDFVDTLKIARRILPELKQHRLKDLTNHYNIEFNIQHRSISDCLATKELYESLKQDLILKYGNVSNFNDNFKRKYKKRKRTAAPIKAKNITTDKIDFDIYHPFYKKYFVFTGTLEKFPRKQAMKLIVDIGGFCQDTVTNKTNYLVLGNLEYSNIKGDKSSKQIKAETLSLKGNDIKIISENIFYELIEVE